MSVLEITAGRELAALLRDVKRHGRQAEFTEQGQMVLGDIAIGGVFHTTGYRHESVLRAMEDGDHERERWTREQLLLTTPKGGYHAFQESLDHNLVPTLGRAFMANLLYFPATAKISTWYFGPFVNNATVDDTWASNWAGASSGPKATELPAASVVGGARLAAVFNVASTDGTITQQNADVTMLTFNTGASGITIYGVTINSTSTIGYNVTDKITSAATLLDEPKGTFAAADKFGMQYVLGITNAP